MKSKVSLVLVPLLVPVVGFGLTLEEAVQHVNDTNPVVRERVQNYKATGQDVKVAESEFMPRLDIAVYGSRETTRSVATSQQTRNLIRNGTTFTASINLFNGFGSLYSIKEQNSRVEAAQGNIVYTSNSLSLETTEAYLELLKQNELLEIAKKNLETHQDIYNKIKKRTEGGFGSKSEQDQSKGRLSLAKSNVIVQQNNYKDALTKFERIYGQNVDIKDLSKPAFSYPLPSTLEDAIAQAKENHPALALQNSNIHAAEHRLEVAKKEFFPKLDAEFGIDDTKNVAGLVGPDRRKYSMLTLSYNLFNGMADLAKKEQRQIMVLQEKEVGDNIERQVEENVKFAWIAYDAINEQVPYLKEHRDYSKSTLDSYRKEFSLGRRTLLDILDTENEQTSAQKEVVKAEYDLLLAKYRILEGVGALSSDMNALPAY